MNKQSNQKPFRIFSERKVNTRTIEPRLEKTKLSLKETIISIGMILGGILGVLIVVVILISIIVFIVSQIRAIIYMLQSYMNDV